MKNKETVKLQVKAYKEDHTESYATKQKEYRDANKERINLYGKEYYRQNKKEIAVKARKYYLYNIEAFNARDAKRRTAKMHRCPIWLTVEHLQEMKDIYAECSLIQEQTGVKHHVDHIQPLQGKDRSGLHVPWNLQILTASENIAKSNNVKL